jgi:hypothetical protein
MLAAPPASRGQDSGGQGVRAKLEERFGPGSFARSFTALCGSFGESAGPSPDPALVWERVIRRFATIENVRLLLGN